MFLTLFFLFIPGAISATLPLNITDFGPYSRPAPGNLDLRLDPFPNPFPIPDTDITIQWYQPPDSGDLPKADIEGAFLECESIAAAYMRSVGDGPIPDHFHAVCRSVVVIFRHESQGAFGFILYSEISDILMATSWIISREGYRESGVRVFQTHGGGLIGSVSVVGVY